MRGKTADEVANLSNAMYVELTRNTRGAPAPAPAPAPSGMPTQEQWLTQPDVATAQYVDNRFTPIIQNAYTQMGQQAREIVRMRYPDEFRKWGPEIDLYIQQTDPQIRNVDMMEKVVQLVRGNHIDEIVAERAEKELNRRIESGTILRPGSAPASSPATPGVLPGGQVDLATAGLPPNYAGVLKHYDITPQVLDEFLLKTECAGDYALLPGARTRWVERAKKGDIITEHRADRVLVSTVGG